MHIDELKAHLADCGAVEVARTHDGACVSGERETQEAAREAAVAVVHALPVGCILAHAPGIVGRGDHAYFEVHALCAVEEDALGEIESRARTAHTKLGIAADALATAGDAMASLDGHHDIAGEGL
jgi:hypothetical protein